MNLEIQTLDRRAQRDCVACRQLDQDDAPWPPEAAHTCRRAPTLPAATIADRTRRHTQTRLDREVRIRAERLADLDA